MSTCQLQMPNQANLFGHIEENAKLGLKMLEADSRVGESVIICGAGPSLADHLPEVRAWDKWTPTAKWACNGALPYLMDNGVWPTHGFTIDQSEAMLDEWSRVWDITYYVASSVSPKLLQHLLDTGAMVRLFHSFLGVPHETPDYEMSLYTSLYPVSVQVGHGLNSVPRAVCLALAMGFSDIRVYGADCGVVGGPPMPHSGEDGYPEWLDEITLYADGRKASAYGENASMCEAIIEGRRWHSRPDMIISARHLLELQQAFPNRITYVGDTLPNALDAVERDPAFMSNLPRLSATGEVSNLTAA